MVNLDHSVYKQIIPEIIRWCEALKPIFLETVIGF